GVVRRAPVRAQGQPPEARDPPPDPRHAPCARNGHGGPARERRHPLARGRARNRADDPRGAGRAGLAAAPSVERALGLMCGAGALPARVAREAKRRGFRIVAFAFGETPGLDGAVDRLVPSSVADIAAVLAGLRAERVSAAVFCGRFGARELLQARGDAAAEAMGGATETSGRGRALAGPGAVVVKAVAPDNDYRFDVPSVGPETLEVMAAGGAAALAIETARVLVLEREQAVEIADRHGIALVGVAGDRDGGA